jgi:predicted metal-dependent HD superfamily phosphohydrolase
MSHVSEAAAAVPRSPLARVFDDALVTAGSRADLGERVAAFVDLARRYQEPGRHYHTLRHVAETSAALRVLLAAQRRPPAQRAADVCVLAVYFHDAVYEPRLADNEQRSAELAIDVLARLGCPNGIGAAVARLVLATASHRSTQDDEALVNDADLRVLARPPAAYDRYVRRVRREYGWVGERAWREGRTPLLRGLLAGPLYATEWARRNWEPLARLNLNRELHALGRGLDAGP